MVSTDTIRFWDAEFAAQEVSTNLDSAEQDVLDRCIAFFGDLTNKDVLEIGCGLGQTSTALARLGANVVALD